MPQRITRRRFVGTSLGLAVVSPVIHLQPIDAAPLESAARQTTRFPAAERGMLRAVIDVIIPADGRMPPASAVGGLAYAERVTAADRKTRDLLMSGLRALDAHTRKTTGVAVAASGAEQQAAALAHLEKSDAPPGFVAALRDVVYEAYYTQPQVWKLLGYTFRRSGRRTARLEPFDERRVARVREVAPFYRQISS
jgi:Gluconate 2-dehydrogenase subunit 3